MPPSFHLEDVAHWLSKSGSLSSFAVELRALSAECTPQQAVDLYIGLRDTGERWESEWRGEFLEFFPQVKDLLPPLADAEQWPALLADKIRTQSVSEVFSFLDSVGIANQEFDPKEEYEYACGFGRADDISDIPFEFYPLENTGSELDPIPLARKIGRQDMVEYLEATLEQLKQKYRESWALGRKLALEAKDT